MGEMDKVLAFSDKGAAGLAATLTNCAQQTQPLSLSIGAMDKSACFLVGTDSTHGCCGVAVDVAVLEVDGASPKYTDTSPLHDSTNVPFEKVEGKIHGGD